MKLSKFSAIQSRFFAIAKGAALTLAAVALLVSCGEDEPAGPSGDSVVSFSIPGLMTKTMLPAAPSFTALLDLAKTGSKTTAVTVSYDAEALETFKAANSLYSGLQALPESAATISSPVTLNSSSASVELTFDVEVLKDLITIDAELEYAFPVKITAVTGDKVTIDPDKNYAIVGVKINSTTPVGPNPDDPNVVSISDLGKVVPVDNKPSNFYRNVNLSEKEVTLTVRKGTVAESDVTVTLATDPSLVYIYNLENTASYVALATAAFDIADMELVIAEGETTASTTITIDPTKVDFTKINGATFMLPVKVSAVDVAGLEINTTPIYFTLEMKSITGEYNVVINPDEDAQWDTDSEKADLYSSPDLLIEAQEDGLFPDEGLIKTLTGTVEYWDWRDDGDYTKPDVKIMGPDDAILPTRWNVYDGASTVYRFTNEEVAPNEYKIDILYDNLSWAGEHSNYANGYEAYEPGVGLPKLVQNSYFNIETKVLTINWDGYSPGWFTTTPAKVSRTYTPTSK